MPSSSNASPRPLVPLVATGTESRPLAVCAAELRHLSSHRDDATAIAALAIVDQLASLSTITVRDYEAIHLAIVAAKRAAVGSIATRAVWAHVYHLSCDAYTDLLWAWRAGVLRRRATAPVAPTSADDGAGPEGTGT